MNVNKYGKKHSEDWIEHIVDKVNKYYMGRHVVLWGKYNVSDYIKDKLKEKYGIDVAFYVDGNVKKIDNIEVFSADSLDGKASEYYVVISLAVYQSIRDKMKKGGYKSKVDYYYFSDCVICQKEDYYEDAHGNRIIGKYQGLKFAFSGFGSVIKIGNDVCFQETSIYVHNDSKIEISNNVHFQETKIYVHNDSKIEISNNVHFQETSIGVHNNSGIVIGDANCIQNCIVETGNSVNVELKNEVNLSGSNISICDNASLKIEQKSFIQYGSFNMKEYSNVLIGENVRVYGEMFCTAKWTLFEKASLEIGNHGILQTGKIRLYRNSSMQIGKEFSIWENYFLFLDHDTSITIGNDCMFSYNVFIFSGDLHSIFDVASGKNINSTDEICKNRKIHIGNHVWLGMRVTILYNTQIGDGSIIGAAGLVKGTIPNNCIAAGNPAKVTRKNVSWSRHNGAENIAECGYQYVNYTKI